VNKRKTDPGVRTEIQALRAIAVLAVVLYHLWPEHLTGGYVGVDVFFVISGFLIIGQLIDRPMPLRHFWAKRARRLLPAALLVLVVTAIAILMVVPRILWEQWLREVAVAALYGLNWLLASNSVDYLASENMASPVQHFWSLSVEEQFYLAIPLLFALVYVIFRNRSALIVALGILTVGSFAYSVTTVMLGDPAGYFSSLTRIWQFGAGGLLAVAPSLPLPQIARWLMMTCGFVLIAITTFVYNENTPFPGVAALLPVIGALLFIAGRSNVITDNSAVRWIGDHSYGIYLWHWPPIVLLPYAGVAMTLNVKTAILLGTIIAAFLTKLFLEDPVREGSFAHRSSWVSITAAVLATVCVAGGAAYAGQKQVPDSVIAVPSGSCVGAAALTCADPYEANELTLPEFAATDIGVGVRQIDECKQTTLSSDLLTCVKGDPDGNRTVALVGDSHAGQYLEGLDVWGAENSVRILTYVKSWCPMVGGEIANRDFSDEATVVTCSEFAEKAIADIATQEIDLVLFSNFTLRYTQPSLSGIGRTITTADFLKTWSQIDAPIAILRDNPAAPFDVPLCVAQHLGEYDACAFAQTSYKDPFVEAAEEDGIDVLDNSQIFCTDGQCHSVIGGLIVYFGSHHFTASFSRSLAPLFNEMLPLTDSPPTRAEVGDDQSVAGLQGE
jgi:peptidoglycan/LPS O-acetylase OafA/YrhL